MMRRIACLAIVLLTAFPLLAATQPNPSVRQRELVEKLIVLLNLDSNTHAMIDSLYEQMEKQYFESMGDADPDAAAEVRELFKIFRQRAAKIDLSRILHESYVEIYAKYFTEKELSDLIAFYASATGKKSIEVLPQLMQEGMQAGVQHISPQLETAMREARAELETKKPWRKTMADIRSVATAVEAYAVDNNAYPATDYDGLKELLVPTYIKEMPAQDMWKHAYAYVVSDDHQHYRIVSAGADTIFEWDSRRIVPAKEGVEPEVVFRERPEDDIIYADGMFLQAPVQSKPKE